MGIKGSPVRSFLGRFFNTSVRLGFVKKIFPGWGPLHLANILLLTSTLLGIFFLAKLSSENKSLMRSNAQLASKVSILDGAVSGPPTAEVGDLVPPFETVDLEGRRVAVKYDGSNRYLLFVFSPHCGACKQQFPVWDRISAAARAKGYLVLGLSTGPQTAATLQLTKAMQRQFDLLIMPNLATQRAYRVVAEPLTMLVSPQGRVEWAQYGKLTDDEVKELNSALEVAAVGGPPVNEP